MVTLDKSPHLRNPLLKNLPAPARAQSRPFGDLILWGIIFTLLSFGLVCFQTTASDSLNQTLQGVGLTQAPSVVEAESAQNQIAQLTTSEAEELLDNQPVNADRLALDNQKREKLGDALVELSSRLPPGVDHQKVAQDIQQILSSQAQLSQATGANGADKFAQTVGGEVLPSISVLDHFDNLNTGSLEAAYYKGREASKTAYILFLCLLLSTTLCPMVLTYLLFQKTRRLVNPGVAVALLVVIGTGYYSHGQIYDASYRTVNMKHQYDAIYDLELAQVSASKANLYLDKWLMSANPSATDLQLALDSLSDIFNNHRSVVADSAATLPFSEVAEIATGRKIETTEHGLLIKQMLANPDDLAKYQNIMQAYANLLMKVNGLRLQTGGALPPLQVLTQNSAQLNAAFTTFDQDLDELIQTNRALFETNRDQGLDEVQDLSSLCWAAFIGQVLACWLGLWPRIREYWAP